MKYGETLHSMLPQDIPWWMPDHVVFFGVLYLVLAVLLIGVVCVGVKTYKDMQVLSKEADGKKLKNKAHH